MGWAKLDDRYAFHPKLVGDLEARGLDAAAISYCAGQETDGFVPDSVVTALGAGARSPQGVAERLVKRGRWRRDDERGGYWLHDYLAFNPSRSELEERRTADRLRKASGRKPGGSPPGKTPGRQTDSGEPPSGHRPDSPSRTGVRTRAPDPSRPVVNKSSSSDLGVGGPGADDEEDSPIRTTARLAARRRMERQPAGQVRNPARWVAKVADEIATESGALIEAMLAEGQAPTEVAAALEPDQAPAVERRACCGTSTQTPHRIGCDEANRSPWELDESGDVVRAAAR